MILVGLISMVPIIELRGAIPYAVLWDAQPLWLAILIAVIGNMIPVPFIYLFARKVLVWGADKPVIGKFFSFCLEKGEKGGRKLQEKAGQGLFVALLLFVGIPLPGTGAWTGTLAASILDIQEKCPRLHGRCFGSRNNHVLPQFLCARNLYGTVWIRVL